MRNGCEETAEKERGGERKMRGRNLERLRGGMGKSYYPDMHITNSLQNFKFTPYERGNITFVFNLDDNTNVIATIENLFLYLFLIITII